MPLAIADRRLLRLGVLCALYVAQGVPYGFVAVTLGAYLAGDGAGAGEIGDLSALAMLPWAFKWLWGPVIDRYSRSAMGRRRPWILGAQVMMVSTATALIAVPALREDLALLGWVLFAHNVFVALQDVSVDALAVDLLPERERGTANGLMYGSSYLGVVLGGAGLSTVLAHHGLGAALVVWVVVQTVILLVPLALREREGDALVSWRARPPAATEPAPAPTRKMMTNLFRAFRRRSPLVAAAVALLIMLGASALTAVSVVLLTQRLGWTQEEYGQLAGGIPVLFGLSGAVAGGWLADRLGHRRVVGSTSVLLGVAWLAFAVAEPYWGQRAAIVAFTCVEGLLLGTMSAALFALFMDVTWPRVAATQFTAYMALLNLSRTLGATLAGPATEAFGTAGAFIAFGILQCVVVLLLIPIDPQQNRRDLGHE